MLQRNWALFSGSALPDTTPGNTVAACTEQDNMLLRTITVAAKLCLTREGADAVTSTSRHVGSVFQC